MRILTILLAFAFAAPALAWESQPNPVIVNTTRVGSASVSPGSVKYWDFNTSTAESGFLDVSACTYVAIDLNPDVDGTATGATVHIRGHSAPKSATNVCNNGRIIVREADGVPPVDASDAIALDGSEGSASFTIIPDLPLLCVDVQANTNPDGARVTIQCKGSK
jgi:hypothetical protein